MSDELFNGVPIIELSWEELKQELTTLDRAQIVVNTVFQRLKETSNGDGEREFRTPEYEKISNILRFCLFNLPEEVPSVSVIAKFQRIEKEPLTNRDYVLRALQRFIYRLDPSIETNDNEEVEYEFVVLPPDMPPELQKEHFGSVARSLSGNVRETIRTNMSSEINVLEVNPHGKVGEAAVEFIRASKYFIPVKEVNAIILNSENKSLTPLLFPDGLGGLDVRPVDNFLKGAKGF